MFAIMGDEGDITTNFGYAEGGRDERVDSMSSDEKSQPTTLQGSEGNLMGWSEGGRESGSGVGEWTAIIMAYSFSPVKINGAIYGGLCSCVSSWHGRPQDLPT